MNVVNPSVAEIKETNPFIKIETIGRTCYKSNSPLNDESAKKFYKNLLKSHHYAMIEHTNFVFQVNITPEKEFAYLGVRQKYLNYSYNEKANRFLVSGNLRALNESEGFLFLKALKKVNEDLVYTDFKIPDEQWSETNIKVVNIEDITDLNEEEFMLHSYYTYKFITNRGVSHEFVRHRPASFAQESTRYCCYAKDKFGSEITVIKPIFWDITDENYYLWFRSCYEAEQKYLRLLENHASPQEAREVLPTSTKTEVIMTANAEEWEHFFDLRSREITGKAHPEAKRVADMALKLYEEEKNKYAFG